MKLQIYFQRFNGELAEIPIKQENTRQQLWVKADEAQSRITELENAIYAISRLLKSPYEESIDEARRIAKEALK